MIWITASILAAFLWAFSNIADQITVRKFFKNISSLEIMATSGFISFVPFILCVIIKPDILDVSLIVIAVFITTSFINFAGFIGYCQALKQDEASNAVPLLQLQPILIFIGAYYLLGESVTWQQIAGATLIIIAAIALIYDPTSRRINWSTFAFMGFCTLMLSSTTLIDRYYLIDHEIHWVTMMAWKSLGYTLCSLVVMSVIKPIRINVMNRLTHPIQTGLHLLFTIELAAIIANFCFILALSLAPSAGLVQSIQGLIPAFVLMMGYAGYRLFPDFVKKPKTGKHMGAHIFCLFFILIGLYLLFYNV